MDPISALLSAFGPGALIAGALVYIAMQIRRFATAFEDRDKRRLELSEKHLVVAYDIRHEIRQGLQGGAVTTEHH